MGQFEKPWTFAYIGAVLCLILPVLFSTKELLDIDIDEEEESRTGLLD
jgi:hypothetical protein